MRRTVPSRIHALAPLFFLLLAGGATAAPPLAGLHSIPLIVSTAGTPEAAVLAGLPAVQRMSSQQILFERRLRSDELHSLRRDLANVRLHLASSGNGVQDPTLAGPLRVTLVGTLNRQATIEARVESLDYELARRRR